MLLVAQHKKGIEFLASLRYEFELTTRGTDLSGRPTMRFNSTLLQSFEAPDSVDIWRDELLVDDGARPITQQ